METEMNETKLRPCPFCGHANIELVKHQATSWTAMCGWCEVRIGEVPTKSRAIQAWNDRIGLDINDQIGCLYQIRCLLGDKEGKLMQDEVVERLKQIVNGNARLATELTAAKTELHIETGARKMLEAQLTETTKEMDRFRSLMEPEVWRVVSGILCFFEVAAISDTPMMTSFGLKKKSGEILHEIKLWASKGKTPVERVEELITERDKTRGDLTGLRKITGEWADRVAACPSLGSAPHCGVDCCDCIASEMRREAAKGEK